MFARVSEFKTRLNINKIWMVHSVYDYIKRVFVHCSVRLSEALRKKVWKWTIHSSWQFTRAVLWKMRLDWQKELVDMLAMPSQLHKTVADVIETTVIVMRRNLWLWFLVSVSSQTNLVADKLTVGEFLQKLSHHSFGNERTEGQKRVPMISCCINDCTPSSPPMCTASVL